MAKKACKQCKRIVERGSICPVCNVKELTTSFQGVVVIFNVDSDIARKLEITAPGKYALKM